MTVRLVLHVDGRREFLGRLEGFASRGALFGPVEACATVKRRAAEAARNPSADPLRRGGHVPFGGYRFTRVRDLPADWHDEFGAQALVFEPTLGQALDAEANGRLELLIHAGRVGADGRLRRTNGDVRVDDATLAQLLRATAGGMTLEVVEWPLGLVERLLGRRRKPSDARATAAGAQDDDDDWSDAWSDSGSSWRSADSAGSAGAAAGAAVATGAAVAMAAVHAAEEAGDPGSCGPDHPGVEDTVESSTSY
jgi:hypothetical protein